MEQCIQVRVPLADNDLGDSHDDETVHAIETALANAIGSLGELDGHEFGGGWATIFLYATDGSALLDAVMSCLPTLKLPANSYVLIRYGPPGAGERIIHLPARSHH